MERDVVYLLTDPCRQPTVWSIADIGREIEFFDPESLIRPLCHAGLVYRMGDGFVLATPAAFHMASLVGPVALTLAVGATSQGWAWRCQRRYDPRMADFSQLAHRVVQATIDATEPGEPGTEEPQTPARVNGRNGGKKGGPARAAKLTPEQRSEDRAEGRTGTLGRPACSGAGFCPRRAVNFKIDWPHATAIQGAVAGRRRFQSSRVRP